jgi:hypothetical protein
MTMRLTTPMRTVLTATLGRAMRTPDGETVYQVDSLGVARTVTALQRRGLVVMEARTVLDGNGKAHQATTSWLTAEGIAEARRIVWGQQEDPAPWAVPGVRARCQAGLGEITDRFIQESGIETVTFVPDGARSNDALAIDVRDPHLTPVPAAQEPQEAEERPEPLDPARFSHMVGTVRTQVRKLRRDDDGTWVTVELRYRVEGVKHKAASRRHPASITVWGRCVSWPEGARPGNDTTSWGGAYCSEIFYANPQEAPALVLADWERETLARAGEAPVAVRDVTADEQAAQEPQEAPASAPAAVETQERPDAARAAVVARLDALWSAGYVTSPGLTLEQHRAAAEVIADYKTAGGTKTLHGRDRAALVAEYRAKDPYDVMNTYGSVRLRTGGDVWALVGRNRTGERVEALSREVEYAVRAAGEVAVWSSVTTYADGEERKGADVIAPEVVVVCLAQALSGGHTVHRHARGALRVTRENGTVIVLRPVEGQQG